MREREEGKKESKAAIELMEGSFTGGEGELGCCGPFSSSSILSYLVNGSQSGATEELACRIRPCNTLYRRDEMRSEEKRREGCEIKGGKRGLEYE